MEELGLSYTTIIIAAIANFSVGLLWYSVIFKNASMKEMEMPLFLPGWVSLFWWISILGPLKVNRGIFF